jgi:hypothetical protein
MVSIPAYPMVSLTTRLILSEITYRNLEKQQNLHYITFSTFYKLGLQRDT